MKLVPQLISSKIKAIGNRHVRSRTPEEIGTNLFHSLLKDSVRKRQDSFAAPKMRRFVNRKLNNLKDPIDLLQVIHGMGAMMGWRIRFAPDVEKKLAIYLENYGLKKDQINILIGKATDKEGYIDLNKLINLLKNYDKQAADSSNKTIYLHDQISQIGEILFNIGFDVSEVNEILQSSKYGTKGLDAARLAEELNSRISVFRGPKDVQEFLARFGVKANSIDGREVLADPRIRDVIEQGSTGDKSTKNQFTEELAQVLRQKGLLPEDVKRILESISIDYVKSNILSDKKAKGQNTQAFNGLLDNIMFKKKHGSESKVVVQSMRNRLMGNEIKKEHKTIRIKAGNEHVQGPKLKGIPESRQDEGHKQTKILGPSKRVLNMKIEPKSMMAEKNEMENSGPLNGVITEGPEVSVKSPLKGMGIGLRLQPSSQIETITKIIEQFQLMVRSGYQESKIRLSPPELGDIDLKIAVKQGHLQAQLGIEHPWVKEIIDANINHLKESLSNLGFVVDKFEVSVGLGNGEFQGQWKEFSQDKKSTASFRHNLQVDKSSPVQEDRSNHIGVRDYVINLSV